MNFDLQEIHVLDYEMLFGKGLSVWKSVGMYTNHTGRKTNFRMLGEEPKFFNVHIIDIAKGTMTFREWDVRSNDWSESVSEYTRSLEEFMPTLPTGMSLIVANYQIVYTGKDRFIIRIENALGEGQHIYRIYDKDNALLKIPY